MFVPRIIPVLLLKGKGLVKTQKFKNPRYIGDPINAVKIFNDLEADELIILDIDATKQKRTIDADFVRKVGDEAYMPFGVGGGICSHIQAIELINAGAEKVIFNTILYTNPNVISETAKILGNQSVVASIDVKRNLFGKIGTYIVCGEKKTNLDPVSAAKRAENLGAGEIIINNIERDGCMCGYDMKLIEEVSAAVSIPVIACGGAANLQDMYLAFKGGAHALAAGSMFVYHGARRGVLINYPEKSEIINIFSKHE